jgi:PST family polysaccharide transporter
MGERGLLVFVLAVPLCSFLIGAWLVRRLRLPSAAVSRADLMADARKLIGLGAAVMLAQLIVSLGMLVVRNGIEGREGLASLGQFEAAWLISTVYLGAVLTAMTTDYYPRLTALADDPVAASALINDQTRMALWLCGPVCLGLIALAPLATLVLFSAEFTQSATILQWLVVGDVLKIMAWPLGFALLARNDGSRYLLVETTAIIVFASAVSVLLPVLDLVGTGAAFILMYCAYLPLVRLCLRRHLAFAWDREVKADAALLLGSAILTASLCSFDPVAGGALGLLLAAALGYRSWQRLRKLSGAVGWRALIRRRA